MLSQNQQDEASNRLSLLFHLLGYSVMITASVGLFMLIRFFGEANSRENLVGPMSPMAEPVAKVAVDTLPHVLGALAVVIVLGRLLGSVMAKLGQPRVIGEMLAGIVLGPSILGRISPEVMHFIQPASIGPLLALIAQLGVILYMFLVGLELNPDVLKSKAGASIAISHSSIVVPFLMGSGLALLLHERLAPDGASFTSFALFMGVAMAITAFPVLARILSDRGMEKSSVGAIAISCAAADDVTAWCLLAFVAGVSQADVSSAVRTSVLAVAYIGIVLILAKTFGKKVLGRLNQSTMSARVTAWILVALLVSTLITESIGIHAIFGAFLIGAIIPHDSIVSREFRNKLHDFVTILLLPAFFAVTGMRTQIGLVDNSSDWLICAAIVAVATVGKFGGTFVAAKLTGLDWWTSASLGTLMNTRGLMELIVLNVGLDLGIISPTLFTMMVLMALITTMSTTPLLSFIEWLRNRLDAAPAAAS